MSSITEQIGTITAILETIFFAPFLLSFVAEQRKRLHAIDLSLEIEDVKAAKTRLAGLDDLLFDIRDLIDRAKDPAAYSDLRLGNEILIAGPPLSGKKALAKHIAREARFDRIITVHNPRNVDALARAKHLVRKPLNGKTLLLLPRLDLIDGREDEQVLVELDALIETVSELSHALIIGTTNNLESGSEIDGLFGITLTLPGAPILPVPPMPLLSEVHKMLASVADYYLDRTLKSGYSLSDISKQGFIARVLLSVTNPSQIEDIIVLCQTAAIFRQRTKQTDKRVISSEILETAIRRVVVTDDARRG